MKRDGFRFCVMARIAPGAVELDEEAMGAINALALRALTKEEVAVFRLDLCNNQVDKHFSRFPDEELETINRLVVGRPLMERHDLREGLPRGTFFRSQLWREGDVLSVRPDVYVLRTEENTDFITNIEGGVYREISIGFSFELPECSVCGKDIRDCGHVPGRDYKGQTCVFIMHGVREVLEGSVVAVGSQGTAFVSALRAVEEGKKDELTRSHRGTEGQEEELTQRRGGAEKEFFHVHVPGKICEIGYEILWEDLRGLKIWQREVHFARRAWAKTLQERGHWPALSVNGEARGKVEVVESDAGLICRVAEAFTVGERAELELEVEVMRSALSASGKHRTITEARLIGVDVSRGEDTREPGPDAHSVAVRLRLRRLRLLAKARKR